MNKKQNELIELFNSTKTFTVKLEGREWDKSIHVSLTDLLQLVRLYYEGVLGDIRLNGDSDAI